MGKTIASQTFPKAAIRMTVATLLALALAFAANVTQARAHNWVGPAIVGALIGGAIVHHAYERRHRHYRHRHYDRRAKYNRRYYHGAPVPVIVFPLPYVGMHYGW